MRRFWPLRIYAPYVCKRGFLSHRGVYTIWLALCISNEIGGVLSQKALAERSLYNSMFARLGLRFLFIYVDPLHGSLAGSVGSWLAERFFQL